MKRWVWKEGKLRGPSDHWSPAWNTLHSLVLRGLGSTSLLSIAWCCFFHRTSPGKCSHAVLISISILIHSNSDESVYLLASVCGDSQAIWHKACCFVLLHQPHRNNRDSHLEKMEGTEMTFMGRSLNLRAWMQRWVNGGREYTTPGQNRQWTWNISYFSQNVRNAVWMSSLLSLKCHKSFGFKEIKKRNNS